MSTSTATIEQRQDKLIENIVIHGDLSQLSPKHRSEYYAHVCESLGLNPLTKPFDYIRLNGRLVLYAKKDATDQLRKIYNVSITISSREKIGDIYIVTAKARLPNGREDESTGALPVHGLEGNDLANAFMKAETKAKRRVTLSICGLGMLDESELDTITHLMPDSYTSKKAHNQLQVESRRAANDRQDAVETEEDGQNANDAIQTVANAIEQAADRAVESALEDSTSDSDTLQSLAVSGETTEAIADEDTEDPGEYVIRCGKKYKGVRIKDIEAKELRDYLNWLTDYAKKKSRPLTGDFLEFCERASDYLSR